MMASKKLPMRRVFGEKLVELGKTHPELVVLDADVSCSTQTRLFAEAFPGRFINCGIAEADMVSVAAGIAVAGLRPVVSSFAYLLATRSSDQIRSQVAYNKLPVIIAGGYAGLSDFADGASHQSFEDLAFFRTMPNMKVTCPGDATEVELILEECLKQDEPVFIRLSRAEVERIDYPNRFSIGKACIRQDGQDVAIISTGQMLETALAAGLKLNKDGISTRVIDMHTVKPLDDEAVLSAAKQCRAIVTCEENSLIGGLGSAVASLLATCLPTPMRMIGIHDKFGQSGKYEDLKKDYGLSDKHIIDAVRELLAKKMDSCET